MQVLMSRWQSASVVFCLLNAPHTQLWIALRCREIMRNSPTALRLLKSAMNAVEDGQSGLQQLGGDATMLFYNSEEGNEVQFLPVMSFPGIQMLIMAINHQDIHSDADWWQIGVHTDICVTTAYLFVVSCSAMGLVRKTSEHSVLCLCVPVNLLCVY